MDHVPFTERAGNPLLPDQVNGKLTLEEIEPILVGIVHLITPDQKCINKAMETPLYILGTGKQTGQAIKMLPNLSLIPLLWISPEGQWVEYVLLSCIHSRFLYSCFALNIVMLRGNGKYLLHSEKVLHT